jgi:hypothetical protein
MGMRQPARLEPRPVYGLPEDVIAGAQSVDTRSTSLGVLPLLALLVVLAAATVWLVALPALDRTQSTGRTCEVLVLKSGVTKCVPESAIGGKAARQAKSGTTR